MCGEYEVEEETESEEVEDFNQHYEAPHKTGEEHFIIQRTRQTLTSAIRAHFVGEGWDKKNYFKLDGKCVWIGNTPDSQSMNGKYFKIVKTQKLNQNAKRVTLQEEIY